jgi:hypothetical protein
MEQTTRIWDQQPNETTKAFAGFLVYRSLPPYGENSRSIDQVKKQLGLSSGNNVNGWSSKYNWVERARAFDAYQATRSITLTEVAQEEYAKSTITATSARLVYLGRIVEKMMKRIDEALDKEEEVDAGDVKRVMDMVKTIDDLSRRNAGLPTTYLTKVSEVVEDAEDAIYVIGGGKPEQQSLEAHYDEEDETDGL